MMAATGYSLSEIVTQKHTTEAKRIEAAQELAVVALAFYERLRDGGLYSQAEAKQLTAVMMAGISGKRSE